MDQIEVAHDLGAVADGRCRFLGVLMAHKRAE